MHGTGLSTIHTESAAGSGYLVKRHEGNRGNGAREEGMSEGTRWAPAPSGERARAMVGRCVGYFSGTASDRRLPTPTGRCALKLHSEFLTWKLCFEVLPAWSWPMRSITHNTSTRLSVVIGRMAERPDLVHAMPGRHCRISSQRGLTGWTRLATYPF